MLQCRALKGGMLTQMGWTLMRILYQALCYGFGELDLDSLLPLLFADAVRSLSHLIC
jgi:hypothetical protein